MTIFLAVVASLLAVVGNVPYLRDMVRGTVRPHPYTWLVGSIVSATVLFGMLEKGAGIGALPIAVSELFTILIFLFSFKYGFTGITKSDAAFLCIALAGLVPWVLTNDPTLSIAIAVGVDLVSFAPTVRKSWAHPSTESRALYGSNVLRHMLILASLQTYNLATTLHSIAMIMLNTGMVGILSRTKHPY